MGESSGAEDKIQIDKVFHVQDGGWNPDELFQQAQCQQSASECDPHVAFCESEKKGGNH